MKRGLFVVGAIAVVSGLFLLFNGGQQENRMGIALTNIPTASPIISIEPAVIASSYITNNQGTNYIPDVNFPLEFEGIVGTALNLSWPATTGRVYIQWSTDLVSWTEIRVAHIGMTNRVVSPRAYSRRYFRYRVES